MSTPKTLSVDSAASTIPDNVDTNNDMQAEHGYLRDLSYPCWTVPTPISYRTVNYSRSAWCRTVAFNSGADLPTPAALLGEAEDPLGRGWVHP